MKIVNKLIIQAKYEQWWSVTLRKHLLVGFYGFKFAVILLLKEEGFCQRSTILIEVLNFTTHFLSIHGNKSLKWVLTAANNFPILKTEL